MNNISVSCLTRAEQIPGWGGDKFKELSFYRDDLDTRRLLGMYNLLLNSSQYSAILTFL